MQHLFGQLQDAPSTPARWETGTDNVVKSVGVHISATSSGVDLGQARLDDAAVVALRVDSSTLPFQVRFKPMETLVLPKGLYECCAAPISKRGLQRF